MSIVSILFYGAIALGVVYFYFKRQDEKKNEDFEQREN